jgi:type VII secretion integral membrane protein EccD
MPSIVDIVHVSGGSAELGARWRLSRVGGFALEESMTLRDNAIYDGAVLLLTTTEVPPPAWVDLDPSHTLAQVHGANHDVMRAMPVVGCLTLSAFAATALVWPGAGAIAIRLAVGGAVAVAAAVSAVITHRVRPDPLLSLTLGVVAVMFAATVGFLAVPAGSAAAHALLASAAAMSVTTLLMRLIRSGTICLTAITTLMALAATVSACGIAWRLPSGATGAILASLALATLGLAPRLAIPLTGIGPPPPSIDTDEDPEVDPSRAVLAHHTLTGLVIGSSTSGVLGALVVAFGDLRDRGPSWAAVVFTAVIGLVLLLRSRTYADAIRCTALASSGTACIVVCFALAFVATPQQAHWVCLLAATAGIGALAGLFGITATPIMRRAIELTEYLALAAIVPLACWISGLYELVRGTGLI